MRNVPEFLQAAAGLLSAAIIAAMVPLASSQAAEAGAAQRAVVHHHHVHHVAPVHKPHHRVRHVRHARHLRHSVAPHPAGSSAGLELHSSDRLADAAPRLLDVSTNYDPVRLNSGSALVIDEATNQILLSKNATEVRPIASLTKLMTAAVILDAHLPMDQMITITDDDIDTLKWSHSRLRPGVTLSREELLKLALMASENRAAHALARTYPGGVPAFVVAMNHKAAELGMSHTHYEDPTGLTPHNQSSAHDLALLVRAVYAYPEIRDYSTHPESTVDVGRREIQFRNTDHLVFNHGWDIMLQKTGYINEAGHCLVLNAKVEGRHVVVVLLDAWGKYSHFGDAERIRNWMQGAGRTVLSRLDPNAAVAVRE